MGSRMGVCVCVWGVFNNPLFILKPKPISATFCHETSCLPARVLNVQVQARESSTHGPEGHVDPWYI